MIPVRPEIKKAANGQPCFNEKKPLTSREAAANRHGQSFTYSYSSNIA
jgi:hypothetical protein